MLSEWEGGWLVRNMKSNFQQSSVGGKLVTTLFKIIMMVLSGAD